jgi:hypothetical protein
MANSKITNKNTHKQKSEATYRKQIPLTKKVFSPGIKNT